MRTEQNEVEIEFKIITDIITEEELLNLISASKFKVSEDFLNVLKMKRSSIKYDDIITLLIMSEDILLGYICYQISTINNEYLYDTETMKNYVLDKFNYNSNIMKIETFCISETYRGRGLGKLSINSLYDIAKKYKCIALILTSLPEAISFYEKIGFKFYGEESDDFMLREIIY